MFIIKFQKFDENAIFKCEKVGKKRYTKRKAIEHLKNNGFIPLFKDMKLPTCFKNGRGTYAYIINERD